MKIKITIITSIILISILTIHAYEYERHSKITMRSSMQELVKLFKKKCNISYYSKVTVIWHGLTNDIVWNEEMDKDNTNQCIEIIISEH